jgi:hypothetical protein
MTFDFAQADARQVILACSQAMSAIGTLDALAGERDAALEALHGHVVDVAGRVGAVVPAMAQLEGAASGARAVAGASRDQRHALRATLAEVLVDAGAGSSEGSDLDPAIDVEPAPFPPAPRGPAQGGLEAPDLLRLHRELREWAGEHFGRALDNLVEGIVRLRRLIADREGREFEDLAEALDRALARLAP